MEWVQSVVPLTITPTSLALGIATVFCGRWLFSGKESVGTIDPLKSVSEAMNPHSLTT